MRYGVFDDFNAEPTLLLWASRGCDLEPLMGALEELASGARANLLLDDSLGAMTVGGIQVRIDIGASDRVLVTTEGATRQVRIFLSSHKFKEIHSRLRKLIAHPASAGRRYVDVSRHQPLQIMVSVGEYPEALRNAL